MKSAGPLPPISRSLALPPKSVSLPSCPSSATGYPTAERVPAAY
jgi:hypothetical protein